MSIGGCEYKQDVVDPYGNISSQERKETWTRATAEMNLKTYLMEEAREAMQCMIPFSIGKWLRQKVDQRFLRAGVHGG
jgi:hypothetical protein